MVSILIKRNKCQGDSKHLRSTWNSYLITPGFWKIRYFLRLDKTGKPVQGRLYNGRLSAIDFDWGHDHYNNPGKGGNGQKFSKGVVHVQEYRFRKDGTVDRISQNARLMTNDEIKTYGPILKYFDPKIKF